MDDQSQSYIILQDTTLDLFLAWLNSTLQKYNAYIDIHLYKKSRYLFPNPPLNYYLFTNDVNATNPRIVTGISQFHVQELGPNRLKLEYQYVADNPENVNATNRHISLINEINSYWSSNSKSTSIQKSDETLKEILQALQKVQQSARPGSQVHVETLESKIVSKTVKRPVLALFAGSLSMILVFIIFFILPIT